MPAHYTHITIADARASLKLAIALLFNLGVAPDQIIKICDRYLQEFSQRLPGSAAAAGEPKGERPPGGQEDALIFDEERREVRSQGVRVVLSPNEMKLYKLFLDNPGKVVSHQELVQSVQGQEVETDDPASLSRPMLSRLRQKLAEIDGSEKWFEVVRGVGYVYVGLPRA